MIQVNIDKAKAVAHEIRRAMREQEFAPYDKAIGAQIPGNTDAAEPARQAIRAKYAVVQAQVEAAKSANALKAALGI